VRGHHHDDRATDHHNHRPAANHDRAPANHNRADQHRQGAPMGEQTMSDVTIHVPTAHMNLSGVAPNDEVTEADIIKVQEAQLQAAAVRIQELEVATQTIVNIAACALKVLADSGLTDAPDEFSFSYDLVERMRDTPITCTRDFAGGIIVKFREQSPAAILVER
jgi:hypothetical protein